jgi:HlyD family secretion protein
MGVKVAFHESAEAADATPRARLFVPQRAVRKDGGRDVVFVVSDGEAERRAVTLGAEAGEEIEVVAGLSVGEQVVVEGPATLAQGDRVKIGVKS